MMLKIEHDVLQMMHMSRCLGSVKFVWMLGMKSREFVSFGQKRSTHSQVWIVKEPLMLLKTLDVHYRDEIVYHTVYKMLG